MQPPCIICPHAKWSQIYFIESNPSYKLSKRNVLSINKIMHFDPYMFFYFTKTLTVHLTLAILL